MPPMAITLAVLKLLRSKTVKLLQPLNMLTIWVTALVFI